jgi:signal transduction histidine kinase
VVSAALDLSWINRLAVESHLSPGATFTLVNGKGEVLLRYPGGADQTKTFLLSDISGPLDLSSDRVETLEATGSDGVHRLFAFSRLKNAVGGQLVYAAVDLPMDIAFAKTGEILAQQLTALGILAAIILGSVWFGTDVLVLRRIRDIIAATKQMAQGNLRARTTLAYDTSELGQMARAFDNLAKALETRETEAVQSAKQIHQQRRQQEALYALNRGITSTLDVASVLTTLLDHIAVLFPSCAVAVSWTNEQTKDLETIAHRGASDGKTADADQTSLQPLVAAVLEQQAPLALSTTSAIHCAGDQEILVRFSWAAYLGLPLTVKGEVLGVLSFYSRAKGQFSADEISFLNALVNEAATAIHNSQLFEQTRAQAVELEKSNRIKDEFLGVMSHELRTPLNIIMNYAEALRMGTFGDIGADQVRGTEKIRVQASHLLALINGILEITKIESGTISVEARPVDLNDFMAELKSDYMLPREKDVALLWDHGADLATIITDRIKLKQIVTNLINNAIKFTDKGSVTIGAKTTMDGRTLELHVADTGPGIPEALLPLVFDKFRQIDSATTRNYSGAGLGLYIVKNFVSLLGGTIDVHSKLGEGSVFIVRLATAPDDKKLDKKSSEGILVGTYALS